MITQRDVSFQTELFEVQPEHGSARPEGCAPSRTAESGVGEGTFGGQRTTKFAGSPERGSTAITRQSSIEWQHPHGPAQIIDDKATAFSQTKLTRAPQTPRALSGRANRACMPAAKFLDVRAVAARYAVGSRRYGAGFSYNRASLHPSGFRTARQGGALRTLKGSKTKCSPSRNARPQERASRRRLEREDDRVDGGADHGAEKDLLLMFHEHRIGRGTPEFEQAEKLHDARMKRLRDGPQ